MKAHNELRFSLSRALKTLKKLRVAIVAGEYNTIQRVGSGLPDEHFEAFGVQSVQRALPLLRKHELPVVICDLSLIGGSGVDLLRALAAGPRRHRGLRFLLHQEGDAVPARGENNVLLYHDLLVMSELDGAARHLARWLKDPGRSPDPRTIVGKAGQIRHPLPEDAPQGPPEPPSLLHDSVRGLLEELRERAATHDEMNYWEILGVPRDCDQETLTAHFDQMSIRFHPDRNTGIRNPDVRQILNRVYATISEAYDILSHPDKARFYGRQVDRGILRFDEGDFRGKQRRLSALTEVPSARRYLQHAQTALDGGDIRSASMNLKFALKLDPDNPELIEALANLSS